MTLMVVVKGPVLVAMSSGLVTMSKEVGNGFGYNFETSRYDEFWVLKEMSEL